MLPAVEENRRRIGLCPRPWISGLVLADPAVVDVPGTQPKRCHVGGSDRADAISLVPFWKDAQQVFRERATKEMACRCIKQG